MVNRGSQCPQVLIADSSLSASIEVVYANGDGEYEDLFNKDLTELGLARTTTFSHVCCREFERLREEGGPGRKALECLPRADIFG